MLFYVLHHVVQQATPNRVSDVQKNLWVFLAGTMLWSLVWTVVHNPEVAGVRIDDTCPPFLRVVIMAAKYGFPFLLVTDIVAWAVIYKYRWGWSLTHEGTSAVTDDPTEVNRQKEALNKHLQQEHKENEDGDGNDDREGR